MAKRLSTLLILLFFFKLGIGQQSNFSAFSYTPPPNFSKSEQGGKCIYTATNTTTNAYCMIVINSIDKGTSNVKKDFSNQWNEKLKGLLKPETAPLTEDGGSSGNWKMIIGSSTFKQSGSVSAILMATYSTTAKCASIIYLFNDTGYRKIIDQFSASVNITNTLDADTTQTLQSNSLIGEWFNNSDVLSNYVNSSGQFIGDASIVSNERYIFSTNGRYESFYATTISNKTHTYLYKGKYIINGNTITLIPDSYEHKINLKPAPLSNNPNNLKIVYLNFSFEKNIEKNISALRFTGSDNYRSDLFYKKPPVH